MIVSPEMNYHFRISSLIVPVTYSNKKQMLLKSMCFRFCKMQTWEFLFMEHCQFDVTELLLLPRALLTPAFLDFMLSVMNIVQNESGPSYLNRKDVCIN
ncbi:hypothetical protein CEXT_259681 [Caerostris extrusa]|uniref:Uncharacterized protein n=1 Tax=Caerostris extrusa TaxID=172846 RepID=A0AAV4WMW4_CAEEX|nr:hypothetical protein CEXT_259681 [Caerostris extrusa]